MELEFTPPPGGYPTYPLIGNSTLHYKLSAKMKKRIAGAAKRMGDAARKRGLTKQKSLIN